MTNSKTREITLLAACIAILFVQEQVLAPIPNVQFSVVLLFVYSKCFNFTQTTIIVTIHVLLDNLFMGSIGLINVVVPMYLAWMLIPIAYHLFLKNVKSVFLIAFVGYIFGHVYGLMYVPFQALLTNVDIRAYMIGDIPFEISMAISSFLTIIWLYEPLVKRIKSLKHKYDTQQVIF